MEVKVMNVTRSGRICFVFSQLLSGIKKPTKRPHQCTTRSASSVCIRYRTKFYTEIRKKIQN